MDTFIHNEAFQNSGFIIEDDCFMCEDIYTSSHHLENYMVVRENRVREFVDILSKYMMKQRGSSLSSGRMIENFLNPVRLIDQHNRFSQSQEYGGSSSGRGNFYNTTTMLKILLRIDNIQNELISSLIYIIIRIINDDVKQAGDDLNIKDTMRSCAMKIFNHIRWNDAIHNGSYLIECLITQLIPLLSCDKSFQIEVISSLPSLVPDSDHEQLVINLFEIMSMYPDLVPCVFDTISNLNLSKNSAGRSRAIEEAQAQLTSATEKELPIIVRFILDMSTDKDVARETIQELRAKLCEFLESSNPAIMSYDRTGQEYDPFLSQRLPPNHHHMTESSSSSNSVRNKQRNEFLSCVNLILTSLKSSFLSNPLLVVAFYKIMDDPHDRLSVVDLWIIFSLYNSSKYRFKLTGILLKKYAGGLLSFDIIIKALQSYTTILSDLFNDIMSIAQYALSLPPMQSRLMNGSNRSSHHTSSQHDMITQASTSKPTQLPSSHMMDNHNLSSSYLHEISQAFAIEYYLAIYCAFTSSSYRQDIIAALISHVNSPHDYESLAGLRILSIISDCEFQMVKDQHCSTNISSPFSTQPNASLLNNVFNCLMIHDHRHDSQSSSPNKLKSFLPFLQTLIYDTNKLSYHQIRIVFRIMFQIAIDWNRLQSHHFDDRSSSSSLRDLTSYLPDEVMNILRKYADKLNLKFKRISALGLISLLVVLSDYALSTPYHTDADNHHDDEKQGDDDTTSSSLSVLMQHIFEHVIIDKFIQHEEIKGFIFDELSLAITSHSLSMNLLDLIMSKVDDDLTKYLSFQLSRHQPTQKMWHEFVSRNRTGSQLIAADRSYFGCGLLIVTDPAATSSSSILTQGVGRYPASQHASTTSNHPDVDHDSTTYVQILTKALSYHNRCNSMNSSSSSSSSSSVHDRGNRDQEAIISSAKAFLSLSTHNTSAAALQLLGRCHRMMRGSVDDIGGLIYAPLELPSPNLVNVIENLNLLCQAIICQSYRLAVDWMRELINIFSLSSSSSSSGDEQPQHHHQHHLNAETGRLIHRFNSLVDMEQEMVILLQRCPDIFNIIFPNRHLFIQPSKPKKSVTTSSSNAKKKRKKKKDDVDADDNNDDNNDDIFNHDIVDPVISDPIKPEHDMLESDYIESMVESIFRPVNGYAAIILGFGATSYPLFYDGEVSLPSHNKSSTSSLIAPPCHSQKAKKSSIEEDHLTTRLQEKSCMRLLQLLLSSCKAYTSSKKSSSRVTTGSDDQPQDACHMMISINDILPSTHASKLRMDPSTSPFLPTIDKFMSANHISIHDMGEIEYYVYLEHQNVFHSLHNIIDTFAQALAHDHSSGHDDHHMNAGLGINTISAIARDPNETFHLDTPGRHHSSHYLATNKLHDTTSLSPEEMLSKMVLVFSIIETIIDAKPLREVAFNRVSYYLQLILENDNVETTIIPSSPSLSSSMPMLLDIFASLSGADYLPSSSSSSSHNHHQASQDDNPYSISQVRSTDPFRYLQFSIYGLFETINNIMCRIKKPIFYDIVITMLRIVEKLAKFMHEVLMIAHDTCPANHPIIALLSDAYHELRDHIRSSCENLLIVDWNASYDNMKMKRRYTNKDLGLIISLHLRYQPDHNKKIHRLLYFAREILSEVISSSSNVDMVANDHDIIPGQHHVYRTLSVDSSFLIYYACLLYELCDVWKTYMTSIRDTWKQQPKSSSSKVVPEEKLEDMKSMIETFRDLVNLTKNDTISSKTAVIMNSMKYGGQFITAVLDSMDVMTQLYKHYPTQMVDVVGSMQKGTRQLQSLCAHGIINRDKSLAKEVPQLKKLLEKFIFVMKSMFADSDILENIVVKALKSRNVDGSARSKNDMTASSSEKPSKAKKSKATKRASSSATIAGDMNSSPSESQPSSKLTSKAKKPRVSKRKIAAVQEEEDDEDNLHGVTGIIEDVDVDVEDDKENEYHQDRGSAKNRIFIDRYDEQVDEDDEPVIVSTSIRCNPSSNVQSRMIVDEDEDLNQQFDDAMADEDEDDDVEVVHYHTASNKRRYYKPVIDESSDEVDDEEDEEEDDESYASDDPDWVKGYAGM